jgi:hypothetical protein
MVFMGIEDIVVQFVSTLFGVLIGIPVAFWIDRRLTKRHDKERAVSILTILQEEITRNLALLKQIKKELGQPNYIIFYNIDMNTWKNLSLEDFEGIIASNILRSIYHLYYEYGHLNRKIDAQFSMHYSAVRASQNYLAERQIIVGAILLHATTLEKETDQLIRDISKEIVRLTNKEFNGLTRATYVCINRLAKRLKLNLIYRGLQ